MRTVLAACLLLPAALPGCVIHMEARSRVQAAREDHFEFATAGASALRVETRNGPIVVTAAPDDSVSCDVKFTAGAGNEEKARALVEQLFLRERREGDTLVIEVVAPPGDVSYGAALRLQVPEGMALALETRNGAIEVLSAFPEVRATTSNGPVAVLVDGGHAELHSSNGSMALAGSPATVAMSTSNGAVTLRLAGDWSGRGSVETSNGSITLECEGRLGCSFSTDTSNGRVRVAGGEVRMLGSADEAQGPHVDLRTSNGPILIRQSGDGA